MKLHSLLVVIGRMKLRSLVLGVLVVISLGASCLIALGEILVAQGAPSQEAAPPAVQAPEKPAAAEPALTELQRLKRAEHYRITSELNDPRKMGEAVAAFVVQWYQAAQKAFKEREDYDRSLAVPGYDGPTGPEGTYKKKPAGK